MLWHACVRLILRAYDQHGVCNFIRRGLQLAQQVKEGDQRQVVELAAATPAPVRCLQRGVPRSDRFSCSPFSCRVPAQRVKHCG